MEMIETALNRVVLQQNMDAVVEDAVARLFANAIAEAARWVEVRLSI